NRLGAPWQHVVDENIIARFVDSLLRGTSQVMFQNNPLTGLLILIGIFYNSLLLGGAAVLGLIVSTLTASALGADRAMIRNGLFGFNGVLLGIGLAAFLQLNPALVIYIILGAIVTTIIMAALANLLNVWDVPALTAPFVLTAWFFIFAAFLFAHIRTNTTIHPALYVPTASMETALRPVPTTTTGAGITAGNLAEALFRGVGEVFLQDNLVTGIIFVIALLINSPASAAMSLIGSIVGIIMALAVLGGNGYWVFHGLYGFNAVLCAIAIGGIFYVFSWRSVFYAILCAAIGTILMASLSVILSPWGVPALTGPFVIATWFFLFPKSIFHVLQPVALADVATPELVRSQYITREEYPPEIRPGGEIAPQP
ncbi:MAG TPA: urea transporter, partial [Ktedonobacteraceae bacterium]|nr:urea transporter [Ktedonobacteraceae bacterium]